MVLFDAHPRSSCLVWGRPTFPSTFLIQSPRDDFLGERGCIVLDCNPDMNWSAEQLGITDRIASSTMEDIPLSDSKFVVQYMSHSDFPGCRIIDILLLMLGEKIADSSVYICCGVTGYTRIVWSKIVCINMYVYIREIVGVLRFAMTPRRQRRKVCVAKLMVLRCNRRNRRRRKSRCVCVSRKVSSADTFS